jgi:hypothetical protein
MVPRWMFRKVNLIALFLSLSGCALTLYAGIRGPGKYSGVVIFDRWDTCFLLSGPYITYVSEKVKENLRAYKDQAMQVDASEVLQLMNPGDGLIQKYTIVGPAPKDSSRQVIEGIHISIKNNFARDRTPTFLIKIENSSDKPVQIDSGEIGPVLLGLKIDLSFNPSDGKSMAWITRASLPTPSSAMSFTVNNHTTSASYGIDPNTNLPEWFALNPGESKQVRIKFQVPPGPYQFLVGFGGGVHAGESLASNAISFHVDSEGTPSLDK